MNRIRGLRPANRHDLRMAHYGLLGDLKSPSDYIKPFRSIRAGDRVWLWVRVSSVLQYANGNHLDQEAYLRKVVDAVGAYVAGVTHFTGRASEADESLEEAADRAAAAGAVLLAESTSRFARHPSYHSKRHPNLIAGPRELRHLRYICGDTLLVTWLNPNASGSEERAHQSKRGQQQKGKKGGRPTPGFKKRLGRILLSKVFWFSLVGYSVRRIAFMLKQHPTQIQRLRDKVNGS